MNRQFWIRKTTGALLCASAVALVGCNSQQPPATSNTASAPAATGSATQAAAPYVPPSAEQLYQMVAPIALFPDKLVAQVLAGATYPDQITSADGLITVSPNLKGADLQTAIAPKPWDSSVKGLAAFPSVLDQMAKNIDWTTALGEAYVNDPTDVMNAIQVMRARATKQGSLRNSAQMQVVTQSSTMTSDNGDEDDNGSEDGETVYSGPAVVPAPQQIIEIEPAQSDTVYVPEYDPQTVYGEEVASYPGYAYERPREYSTGQLVGVGAVGFGVGVLVGALIEHHHDQPRADYGWNSWGMHWRDRGPGGSAGGHSQRPAVVHNNATYVSRSTTVVNRYVTNNNINNSRHVVYNHSNVNSNNNQHNTATANRQSNSIQRLDNHAAHGKTAASATNPAGSRPVAARAPTPTAHRPMSMPNFGATRRAAPTHAPQPNTHATDARHGATAIARTRSPTRSTPEPVRPSAPAKVPAENSRNTPPPAHHTETARAVQPRVTTPVRREPHATARPATHVPPHAVASQQARLDAARAAQHPAQHKPPVHKKKDKKQHQ